MKTSEVKDCFMCKNSSIYGESNDPSVCCNSPDTEHKNCFMSDGRFCAEYCKGYENKIVIVSCNARCNGKNNFCINVIKDAVEKGKIVFSAHSYHILDEMKKLNYHTKTYKHDDVPIGLYISKEEMKDED